MSLPSELRTLCHLLSSTESSQLPHITPLLLRNVMCCGEVLSAGDENGKASNALEHFVLVHKFKTQLTTLLNGKEPGGRFAAVVLIKAVVEEGGWEVLRGSEAWVKGLIVVLAKPDTTAIKSISILTLVSIYALTHQYQTLVREITTPTLPTFVSSCLNLMPKSTPTSYKNLNGQEFLIENVFEAFSALVPHHPTIFRPFSSQIKLATRLYLAPTMSDGCFVPPSLQESASRLAVVIHQTAAKNTASDEWAKALNSHIKAAHLTADHVFRAVIEDWESVSGYVSQQIDMNTTIHGGSESMDSLPEWSGIFSGVERLTGILALLAQYLRSSTAAAVSIPIGTIIDLVTRMLSLAKSNGSARVSSSARINSAVDRDEREGLWAGLPQIHNASMQLLTSLMNRLQAGFLPLSQGCLDQIAWLFPFGHLNEEFRKNVYLLVTKLLCCGGPLLPKDLVSKLSVIVLACCKDLLPALAKGTKNLSQKEGTKKVDSNGSSSNADTFLQSNVATNPHKQCPGLNAAANQLLPVLLSHVPQAHLGFPLRSLIDRTAIIMQHKDAMIASVLSPFPANRHALPSILPYLSRQFPEAGAVESLLRPRFPPLVTRQSELHDLDIDLEKIVESYAEISDDMERDAITTTPNSPAPKSPLGETPIENHATEIKSIVSSPLLSTKTSNAWTNVSEISTSKTVAEPASFPKRQLSEFILDSTSTFPEEEPVSKRGKYEVEVDRRRPTALPTRCEENNETQPIPIQNTSADLEEDSDDESVPSLKMEFDSSSEE